MEKGVPLFDGATIENLFAVPFDIDENGADLKPDAIMARITAIIEEANRNIDIKNVCFDSLGGIYTTIEQTKEYNRLTLTKDGKLDHFQRGTAMFTCYSNLIELLQSVGSFGKRLVVTLPAKASSIDQQTGEALAITPDLPYFDIATKLVPKFADVIPISTRASCWGRSCLDLRLATEKTIKARDTKAITKHANLEARVSCIPLGADIDSLPPDLFFIEHYAKQVLEAQQQTQEVITNG
jgi:hypothetical protein